MDNKLYRSMVLDNNSIDKENRTVELSFSSETPVLRRGFYEVLSHRAEDADLSILNSGSAPFLLSHDHNVQIGVVTNASVVDGKGRATIKLSRSQLGEEIWTDICDGIRKNISCGYMVGERTLDGKLDDKNVYRFRWVGLEISSVPIPADQNVGIGRALDDSEETNLTLNSTESANPITNKETPNMDTQDNLEIAAIEEASRAAAVTTTSRAANIADVEAICKRYGFESKIEELVLAERSLDEVKTEITKAWSERSKATKFSAAPAVHIPQQRTFDIATAARAAASGDWDKAGYEREICQENGRNAPKGWDKNTLILDPNMEVRASNTVGGATSGAELVGTTYMPSKLIDSLWNKTFLGKVGTDSMLGLQGNVSFPVISSNATSTFIGETANLPAAQALTTGLKSVSPRQLVSKFQYSRQLLVQGLPNIQQKILEQLYNSIAQALDAAALSNSGTTLSTTGLLNEAAFTVAAGTNGAVPSMKAFHDMRKALVNAKTLDGNLAYVISGSLNEALHTTLKDSNNTASGYILADGQTTLAGLPYFWSQNIPSNLTKGTHTATDLSAAILGDWSQLLTAQWGSISLQFDDITLADSSQLLVRAYSFWDMCLKRPEAFAIVKDFIA